ncbi:hypothetical protein G7059_00120 [Erysipelothrix sp. HDW6A]|uniref:hypothetical protein n=1 Tax=Erysipelothrix sp. HDW6A TaxID=2714928 RepID=UPI00140855B1|nr:hypothetical protein [Erysipelothrix sp. HDW6A]QIK56360.1 hypothetical protein G7059_00120 [Erysipelothrix sp. HDW6A]
MDKIKKWLEPKKNKLIAGVITVLVLAGVGFGVWSLSQSKSVEPVIVFKENIVFEYGEDVSNDINKLVGRILDEDDKNNANVLTSYVKDDDHEQILNELNADNKNAVYFVIEEIKTDVASFGYQERAKEVGLIKQDGSLPDYETEVLTNNENLLHLLNAGGNSEKTEIKEIEKYKTKVNAIKNNEVLKSFDFEYVVIDSQAPVIEGVKDMEIAFGTETLDLTHISFTSKLGGSVIDIEIKGDIDTSVSGQYEMKAIATDDNGNVTEKTFIVTVLEEEKFVEPEVETPTTQTPSNTGGTSSTNKPSNNNGTSINNNTTAQKPAEPSKPVEKPKEPSKPAEPEKPSRPAPSAPTGMKYYKDYGTSEGCIAVMHEVGREHVREWHDNFCDMWGYMYYTPRN